MAEPENHLFGTSASVRSARILYTPSAFARTSLMYLQETGSLEAVQPHTSSREKLQSYLCFVVAAGTGELTYGGRRYALGTGDVVFLDCRQPYSHATGKNLWQLQWCHFDGGAIPAVYEKYRSRGGQPVFRPEDASPFRELLSELYTVAGSEDYIRDMRINTLLSRLLEQIMAYSWNPESAGEHIGSRVDLKEIKAYMDEHYREKLTLSDLSQRFFVDRSYLCKLFKDAYGTTVNGYLVSRKITEAKRLLRFSDKSVEEIGLLLGIGEPAYFSRVFKKVEGVSPRDYRKMW